jgi:hypothetical protein
VDIFAPNSRSVTTNTGKLIYTNGKTGIQVVYDKSGKYFRIENTNIAGKRRYLDLYGNNVSIKWLMVRKWDVLKMNMKQSHISKIQSR